MHFKMSKNAQSFFADIISPAGSHGAENKNKFKFQFDVYYFCALIGMAAIQLDKDILDKDVSDLNDLTDTYPKPYIDCKAQIAGLLVATEAKRQGIDMQSSKLEEMMLRYLSDNETMLSDEGVKTLNAYSFKGYQLIRDYPLIEKPTSREEFLDAFNIALKVHSAK